MIREGMFDEWYEDNPLSVEDHAELIRQQQDGYYLTERAIREDMADQGASDAAHFAYTARANAQHRYSDYDRGVYLAFMDGAKWMAGRPATDDEIRHVTVFLTDSQRSRRTATELGRLMVRGLLSVRRGLETGQGGSSFLERADQYARRNYYPDEQLAFMKGVEWALSYNPVDTDFHVSRMDIGHVGYPSEVVARRVLERFLADCVAGFDELAG